MFKRLHGLYGKDIDNRINDANIKIVNHFTIFRNTVRGEKEK